MVNVSDECLMFYIFLLRTLTVSTWKKNTKITLWEPCITDVVYQLIVCSI